LGGVGRANRRPRAGPSRRPAHPVSPDPPHPVLSVGYRADPGTRVANGRAWPTTRPHPPVVVGPCPYLPGHRRVLGHGPSSRQFEL